MLRVIDSHFLCDTHLKNYCQVSPSLQYFLFLRFSIPLYFSSSSSVMFSKSHIIFVTLLGAKVISYWNLSCNSVF